MKIVCAWCKKNLSSLPSPPGNKQISHGLCDDCRIKIEYNFISLEDFIDKLKKPIIIMNSKCVVLGANQKTLKMLQKSKNALKNQNAGDVMQCVYADLTEGCGHTVHCSGCTIRNSVTKTYETGQSQKNIEAYQYLNTPEKKKRMNLLISTEKIGDFVLLQISDMFEPITSD